MELGLYFHVGKHERGDVEMLKKGEGGKRSLERRMEGRGRRGEKSRGGGGGTWKV